MTNVKWVKLKLPDETARDEFDKLWSSRTEDEETHYSDYEDQESHQKPIFVGQDNNPFAQLKHFNIWTLHLPFRLTRKIVTTIDSVDGVEGIWLSSPYRVQIAIAEAFSENIVKADIEYSINKLNEKTNKL